MTKIEAQLIGQTLLKRGFKDFVLYLFKVIEGKDFIVEKLHDSIFTYFEKVYQGEKTRVNLSLCPRSGKTTISEYFLIYVLTQNPKSNIIYTSYSASLLAEISTKIASILEHPIYKSMFPQKTITKQETSLNPLDEFWKDYLFQQEGKNTYSAKLIRTYAGGVCLFNSIGASITGFGAGIRASKDFSGFLLIDDANKPSEIRSQIIREKVVRYYEETLLSRLNNPTTPIINVQQRLSKHDLTGTLEEKYNFDTLKIPLLDEFGNCNLPHQYTKQRIKELQINNYMFQAQFQQSPIEESGEVIKRSWFNYYDINFKYVYKKIVIASDTAMSTKESADRSCFMVGGITQNNQLHIIDFICGRWDYPTLKQKVIELWNKWQLDKRSTSASALYVEEKASGIQILQELKKTGIPILPLKADKDKYTRVQGVLEYIASGQVFLPHNEQYGFNPEILNEVESFTRDNSHLHDDITDTLVYLINVTIARKQVSILETL